MFLLLLVLGDVHRNLLIVSASLPDDGKEWRKWRAGGRQSKGEGEAHQIPPHVSPPAQEEEHVSPQPHEEGFKNAFMDYRGDGYHRPPMATKPRPGPINNIKRPSPELWP
ncbi:hypothetical protein KP509_02G040700 [Ceratopteris richardii]|uniref:Uncharacterized protein n=1 Tax=Ceratopteris richardii TaxID=49495 RepID=A0A8T2VGI6_CERRI|nr:hypothetical protein KP509_02G040700 [Ceratopteris richardii]